MNINITILVLVRSHLAQAKLAQAIWLKFVARGLRVASCGSSRTPALGADERSLRLPVLLARARPPRAISPCLNSLPPV